ncbi:MAG TPA: hypothetical protein DHN33_10625 [Eubacteriaceae bacterium]|nr:hypothetical protein [Eubacteriaceae bacterium]
MNELGHVFKKIIEIDQKAEQVHEQVEKAIRAEEEETQRTIETFKDEHLGCELGEVEEQHHKRLKELEDQLRDMQEKAEEKQKKMKEAYQAHEGELIETILQEIVER